MEKKRGRPINLSSRRHIETVRLNDEEYEKLLYARDYLKMDKAKIFREGLNVMYDKAVDVFLDTEF